MYRERNLVLADMGFGSYDDYLKSDLWQSIRERLIDGDRECAFCKRLATQVHHASYDAETMEGLADRWLYPVCRRCHEYGEFGKDGVKLGPQEATDRMLGRSIKRQRKRQERYQNNRREAMREIKRKLHPESWKLLQPQTKQQLSYENWQANAGNVTPRAQDYMAEHGTRPPADVIRKRALAALIRSM